MEDVVPKPQITIPKHVGTWLIGTILTISFIQNAGLLIDHPVGCYVNTTPGQSSLLMLTKTLLNSKKVFYSRCHRRRRYFIVPRALSSIALWRPQRSIGASHWFPHLTGFSSQGRAKLRGFCGKTAQKSTQPSPFLTRKPCIEPWPFEIST